MKLLSLGLLGLTTFGIAAGAGEGCSSNVETGTGETATPAATSGAGASGTTSGGGMTSSAPPASGRGGSGPGGKGGPLPKSGVDCTAASGAAGKLKLTPLPFQFTWPVLAVSPVGDDERLFVA